MTSIQGEAIHNKGDKSPNFYTDLKSVLFHSSVSISFFCLTTLQREVTAKATVIRIAIVASALFQEMTYIPVVQQI